MAIPDPFTPMVLAGSIVANLATDILKHHAGRLESTYVGTLLKRAGLLPPNFEERIRTTLSEALTLFFAIYPQYSLSGVTTFFSDPVVAAQIGAYILESRPPNEQEIEQAFERHLGTEPISWILMRERGLIGRDVIQGFMACYRQALNQHLDLPDVAIQLQLLEHTATIIETMKETEERLTASVAEVNTSVQALPNSISELLTTLEISSLNNAEEWSSFPALSNPFQVDAALETRLIELRSLIERPGSMVRVVGTPGDGKTRLVLETLRGSELFQRVLYAEQPTAVTSAFIASLRRAIDIHCVVVVDEVDDDSAERFKRQFSSMPPGVHLVLIGLDAIGRPQRETIQVEGLRDPLLMNVIAAIVPGLPNEVLQSIAQNCERSPKLAVLIAQQINADPTLVQPQRLLADGSVQNTLERYLKLEEEEWKALSIVALLMRLGWLNEAESESEVLFRVAGLDPVDARRKVQNLHVQFGIAPVAGRYRYVSPAILADYYAAKQIGSWTRERLATVFSVLTPAMVDSFAQRLRRLSSVLENRAVVEEVLLGDQGPFRTLDDLESSRIVVLLRHLAAPFPSASLAALRRILGSASIDDLRAATASRRDVVWALEELLWREDTFEGAAALLLRLAIAENETWGNNATQTWVETFQTFLGRTAAGAISRARVLRRAATSTNPFERCLVANALNAALKSESIHRAGMPPSEVEGIPSSEWVPATNSEWWDAIVEYLTILEPLIQDTDEAVRHEATKSFAMSLRTTSTLPPKVFDRWIDMSKHSVAMPYNDREALLIEVAHAEARLDKLITNADNDLSADDRIELQRRLSLLSNLTNKLQGGDFSSRFRWAITQSAYGTRLSADEREENFAHDIEPFAREILQEPTLLLEEVGWLLDNKLWHAIHAFELLGRLDTQRQLVPTLELIVISFPETIIWQSYYEISYAKENGSPSFIDDRILEMRSQGIPVEQQFDLLSRAGYSLVRLQTVVELVETGQIVPSAIRYLAYRPWGNLIPIQQALQLATVAADKAEEPSDVVTFVQVYLDQQSSAINEFKELALRLLLSSSPHIEDDLRAYSWAKLAKFYVEDEPTRIASGALDQIDVHGVGRRSDVDEVLHDAWEHSDKEQLFSDVVAPWILAQPDFVRFLRGANSGLPIHELRVDFLQGWVAEDPDKRAPALLDMIGPPGTPLSDIHAMLLGQFGGEEMESRFSALFLRASWMGNMSDMLKGKLEIAKQWIVDERPAVRNWATGVVRGLEKEITLAQSREAEERFR